MSTASAGRDREYKVRDALKADGYKFLMRAAASKGSADLLLAKPGEILWVQVGTGSKRLGPAERVRFLADADLLDALPIIATVTPRQPIHYVLLANDHHLVDWTPDRVGAA